MRDDGFDGDTAPIEHEMDDFESKSIRLEKLKEQNVDRRAKLQQLALQSQDSKNNNKDPMDLRSALLREIDQIPTLEKPNFDPDPRAFLREVVETYDELVQARAILEQQLEHDKKMIEVNTRLLEENRELNAVLLERNEASQRVASKPVSVECHEEEAKWLNHELAYVTALLDGSGASRRNGLWSLHQLIEELMRRYLSSPSDPFLLVSALPIHPNHIALLLQCCVIQIHEDNQDLVCLTDYLEGTMRSNKVAR